MKTVEQLIFEKRFKDAEFDPNDYNDWAKENEYEAYTLCLAVAKQLQQHLVMQAEASGSAEGAAVASSAVGKGVSDGHDETHVTIRDGEFEWCMACSRQIKRAEH